MSYKDTRSFHKTDFDDGGRKARKGMEHIADRKANKYGEIHDGSEEVANGNTTTDVSTLECNDCGYIGDAKNDFVLVTNPDSVEANNTDADSGAIRACPVCESHDVQPYDEEGF